MNLLFPVPIHVPSLSLQVRACEHAGGRDSFMESDQCLEDVPGGKVTKELCLPPIDLVAKHVMSLIRKYGTRSVFVASDVPPDVHNLKQKLGRKVPTIVCLPDAQIDYSSKDTLHQCSI